MIICMLATALPASEQTAAFQRLDRNGDGKLSRERSWGTRSYTHSWDRDQDGFVTLAEVREFISPSGEPGRCSRPHRRDRRRGHRCRARPSAPPAAVPVATSRPFADLAFAQDWVPGTRTRRKTDERHGDLASPRATADGSSRRPDAGWTFPTAA